MEPAAAKTPIRFREMIIQKRSNPITNVPVQLNYARKQAIAKITPKAAKDINKVPGGKITNEQYSSTVYEVLKKTHKTDLKNNAIHFREAFIGETPNRSLLDKCIVQNVNNNTTKAGVVNIDSLLKRETAKNKKSISQEVCYILSDEDGEEEEEKQEEEERQQQQQQQQQKKKKKTLTGPSNTHQSTSSSTRPTSENVTLVSDAMDLDSRAVPAVDTKGREKKKEEKYNKAELDDKEKRESNKTRDTYISDSESDDDDDDDIDDIDSGSSCYDTGTSDESSMENGDRMRLDTEKHALTQPGIPDYEQTSSYDITSQIEHNATIKKQGKENSTLDSLRGRKKTIQSRLPGSQNSYVDTRATKDQDTDVESITQFSSSDDETERAHSENRPNTDTSGASLLSSSLPSFVVPPTPSTEYTDIEKVGTASSRQDAVRHIPHETGENASQTRNAVSDDVVVEHSELGTGDGLDDASVVKNYADVASLADSIKTHISKSRDGRFYSTIIRAFSSCNSYAFSTSGLAESVAKKDRSKININVDIFFANTMISKLKVEYKDMLKDGLCSIFYYDKSKYTVCVRFSFVSHGDPKKEEEIKLFIESIHIYALLEKTLKAGIKITVTDIEHLLVYIKQNV